MLLKIFSLIFVFMLNSIVGGSISLAAGFSVEAGIITANALSFIPTGVTGLRAGLLKEVWLVDLMEDFIPNTSWLSTLTNMDQFVNNNTINLAEAGMAPDVLVNNNIYPVPFSERDDTPYDIILDTYDTEGTVIRNAEQYELAYDKRQSVIQQHKSALLRKFSAKAAYNIAQDTAIEGATYKGNKVSMDLEYILTLKAWFDSINAPDDRVLIIPPDQFSNLAVDNLDKLLPVFQHRQDLFGFKMFVSNQLPQYDSGDGSKRPFGSLEVGAKSSIAFCPSEVMRALGTFDMFERLKDPEQKGDIINFQVRGIAMPKRKMGLATIIHS